jgi:hypothetical protein
MRRFLAGGLVSANIAHSWESLLPSCLRQRFRNSFPSSRESKWGKPRSKQQRSHLEYENAAGHAIEEYSKSTRPSNVSLDEVRAVFETNEKGRPRQFQRSNAMPHIDAKKGDYHARQTRRPRHRG